MVTHVRVRTRTHTHMLMNAALVTDCIQAISCLQQMSSIPAGSDQKWLWDSSDVCGYPRIVHGGLTAAIIDESFGFLFYALRRHKQLPFFGPAFTAHLEVSYKRVRPPGYCHAYIAGY